MRGGGIQGSRREGEVDLAWSVAGGVGRGRDGRLLAVDWGLEVVWVKEREERRSWQDCLGFLPFLVSIG
jgi:hypothetical protein